MDNRCIVLCDSGIGGLNLLKKLTVRFPKEDFIYFSDGKNLPYGTKSKDELEKIAIDNYNKLCSFCPKLVVFACNTLSVYSRDLFYGASVPVVGVYPSVINGKNGLLLCTEKTAQSKYVASLKNTCNLDVAPMRGLAEEIEYCVRNGRGVDLKDRFVDYTKDYDFISLGCTHYSFLTEKIRKYFPKSQIISGEEYTFQKIEKLLTTCDHCKNDGSIVFIGHNSGYVAEIFNLLIG